jgi:hypothetical protein
MVVSHNSKPHEVNFIDQYFLLQSKRFEFLEPADPAKKSFVLEQNFYQNKSHSTRPPEPGKWFKIQYDETVKVLWLRPYIIKFNFDV